jgi:hypothetical protein
MLADFGLVENPEVVSIAIGMILFIVSFKALMKFFKGDNKPVAVVVSLILGVIAAWRIYTTDLAYNEKFLFYVLIVLGVVILFALIIPFFRAAFKQWMRNTR